jgi:hypothetical protein
VLSLHCGLTVDAINEIVLWAGLIVSTLIMLGNHSVVLFVIIWAIYLSVIEMGDRFMSFQWDILLLEIGFLAILSSSCASFCTSRKVQLNWCYRFLAFKLMFLSGIVKLQSKCPTWEGLTALDYHYATQPLATAAAYFAHQLPPIIQKFSVAATLVIEIPVACMLIFPLPRVRRYATFCQFALQILIILTGNYNFFNLLTMLLMMKVRETDCLYPKTVTVASKAPTQHNDAPETPKRKKALLTPLSSATISKTLSRSDDAESSLPPPALVEPSTSQSAGNSEKEEAIGTVRASNAHTQTSVKMEYSDIVPHMGPVSFLLAPYMIVGNTTFGKMSEIVVFVGLVGYSCYAMFTFDVNSGNIFGSQLQWWRGERLRLDVRWDDLSPYVAPTCLVAICVSIAHVIVLFALKLEQCFIQSLNSHNASTPVGAFRKMMSLLERMVCTATNVLMEFVYTLVSILWILTASVPLLTVANLQPYLPVSVISLYQKCAPFRIVSGYGLFRHMTGVGKFSTEEEARMKGVTEVINNELYSFSKYSPSSVARPEIVLEGLDGDTQTWVEIDFRHKPGSIYSAPTLIAPFQPRLDWQMWFAALGRIEAQPWLVHLMYKLVTTDAQNKRRRGGKSYHSAVVELLSRERYLFWRNPPAAIRAVIYDLDFTRYNTKWAALTPGVEVVPGINIQGEMADLSKALESFSKDANAYLMGYIYGNSSLNRGSNMPTSISRQRQPTRKDAWWQRKNKREYLGAIDQHNPSIREYLTQNGFSLDHKELSVEEQYKMCMDKVEKYEIGYKTGRMKRSKKLSAELGLRGELGSELREFMRTSPKNIWDYGNNLISAALTDISTLYKHTQRSAYYHSVEDAYIAAQYKTCGLMMARKSDIDQGFPVPLVVQCCIAIIIISLTKRLFTRAFTISKKK